MQNAGDLANDPHLTARAFFVQLTHPVLGETISDASPIGFDGDPKNDWRVAPLLGEDNQYVFRQLLGLKKNEFSSLVKRGIIG